MRTNIMTKTTVTDKNLDHFAEFLRNELNNSSLSAQIPNGAHIFHGAYDDENLTQANLKIATNIMLGMSLGYVDEAPLMMIFKYQENRNTLIDLYSQAYKQNTQNLIHSMREENQHQLSNKIEELVAV